MHTSALAESRHADHARSTHGAPRVSCVDPTTTLLALCIGITITLCVTGYQFGRSNHTVYLLDALHRSHPELLANDWFTTRTFQYHAVFGWIARGLMRLNLLEPGFLVGQLALVALFHVAWRRIVLALGGSDRTYLASVLMYYLSAGGTGLGVYQVFQDSSFLPSNVANVAMLWAITMWIEGRVIASGAWLGVAGIFHLNHAVVGVVIWCALLASGPLSLWERVRVRGCSAAKPSPSTNTPSPQPSPKGRGGNASGVLLASALALVPSLINIGFAAVLGLRHDGPSMPLDDFVALFVRLRHPHHYDPRAWPVALWVAFLWPIPLAILGFRSIWKRDDLRPIVARTIYVTAVFTGLILVALVGAGLFFVSERLIQMSLYRFSIYVQLIACIAAAIYLLDAPRLTRRRARFTLAAMVLVATIGPLLVWIGPRLGWLRVGGVGTFINARRGLLTLFCLLCTAPALFDVIARLRQPALRLGGSAAIIALLAGTLAIGWNRWIGLTILLDRPDESYLALCAWARERTPVDAVFVVPPGETEFRYYARRAIVVNFKGVPQFSSELVEWKRRLQDVLGIDDARRIPGGFERAFPAMAAMYDARSGDDLAAVARKYDARYIVATHDLGDSRALRDKLATSTADGRYFLYDLAR